MTSIVGDDNDFLTSFDRSIELDFGEDPSVPSLPSLKNIHKRLNENNDEVIHTCTITLKTNPDDLQTRMLRGITYLRQHDYLHAMSDFDYSIVQANSFHENSGPRDSNFVASLYSRGVCLAGLQRFEEAVTDFTECLRLAPDHFNAAFGRAACYNATGFFSKVCRLLSEMYPHTFIITSILITTRRLRTISMHCREKKSCSNKPIPVRRIDGDGACWIWICAMTQPMTPTKDMSYSAHSCHHHLQGLIMLATVALVPTVTWPCWTTCRERKLPWMPPANLWVSRLPTSRPLPRKQVLTQMVPLPPPLLPRPPPHLPDPLSVHPPPLTYTHPLYPIHLPYPP